MSRLTLADLIATGIPVSPVEAAALTLAVANALERCGRTALPPDEQLVLSSTGHVSLRSVTNATPGEATGGRGDLTAELAALTRRLLQLDRPGPVDRRRRVPAALLVALSRTPRHVDLAPLTLDAFRTALQEHGTPERTQLAAVFWRAARIRMPAPRTAARVDADAASGAAEDRRHNMPRASELRQYLRETELELYAARAAARGVPAAQGAAPPDAETAPAAPPSIARGRPARRPWRAAVAAAAIVIGGVLGTALAFMIAGGSQAPPAATSRSIPLAAPDVSGAPPAGDSAAPDDSGRLVQPLLLSTVVGADVFSPSFAPAGGTLLFHAGRRSAPLMRASVGPAGEVKAVETLLDDSASNYHATMSPDGTRIAFDSDREGERGVYVAHADGSDPRRVSGDRYAAVPSWSPDGNRLAFVRAEPGRPKVWNVWIVEVETGRLERVTRHEVGQPWGASWFPDGRRLAYSVEDRLMVADLDSGVARGYRSPRAGHLVRTPAVSPDGARIVFQVHRDGVWLLDLERARMRRILDDATAEEFVWSPAGDAIAYHARRDGSYGLWRLSLAAGGTN